MQARRQGRLQIGMALGAAAALLVVATYLIVLAIGGLRPATPHRAITVATTAQPEPAVRWCPMEATPRPDRTLHCQGDRFAPAPTSPM